jgi:hypothetical protein
MNSARRTFNVSRDLDGYGCLELVSRFADELSDREILALSPADQAYVLAEIGCIIEEGEVVTDPALDAAELQRAA